MNHLEKKVFPTLTAHFFNSGHGDAYRRNITPCCIFTESFTFPPRTVQKWHEFQNYILGEKPKSRQSWKNWRKNQKNHVSVSFVLETTAFYQKWICRSVRHFFSFFKIFQLCYVNFFNSGHVMVIFQLCSYPRMYVQIFSILSPMVPKLWTTVHLTAWCWLLDRQRETETLIKWSRAFYTLTLVTTCEVGAQIVWRVGV